MIFGSKPIGSSAHSSEFLRIGSLPTKDIMTIRNVVFLGKVGHGKTSMMNKICDSRFPAGMGARSLTDHIQHAMMNPETSVIDTPGFYSSTDVAGHVAAQKVAMEELPLSGIYLVVKYGRADDIAELANQIMDAIGCDDVRLIITHEDVAAVEDAFDPLELRRTLSETLGIDEHKIGSFGKTTPASTARAFIQQTLHQPRLFKMSRQQQAMVAALGVGSRKLNKPVNAIFAKIVAAEVACREATDQGKTYESDFIITSTQQATAEMVNAAKFDIFSNMEEFSEEQQNLLYGKVGVPLSLRLQAFTETTNKLLSYDVTDMSNPNNIYKKCPHCGAVWVKTEGCDGGTICGNIPTASCARKVPLEPEFVEEQGRWILMFRHNSIRRTAAATWSWFLNANPFEHTRTVNKGAGTSHRQRTDAIIESGCGNSITWSTMIPVPPEELAEMKRVELLRESFPEETAKVCFENQVRVKELENKMMLLGMTKE